MPNRSWAPVVVWLGAAALSYLPRSASAGDYLLTVADDQNAVCTEQARKVHAWCEEQRKAGAVCESERSWPIASAAGVVDDLGRYFAGAKPEIPILITAFVNGHVDFCGDSERATVAAALAAIAGLPVLRHENVLADIVRIHASRAILDGLRKQLTRDDLSEPARGRLSDLAVAVENALATRRTAA